MNISKNYFLDLHLFTYTNQFLLKCMSRKIFFQLFSTFPYPDIAVSDAVFFPKRFVSNFSCSQLCPSCNLPLVSSSGVVSDIYIYIYSFISEKPFHFHINSLIIFTILAKKMPALTFA